VKVALIGSVSSSRHTLRGLIRGGVEITGVLGLEASLADRVSDYRDLKPLTDEAGAPFQSFKKVSDEGVAKFLDAHRPDLLFAIGLSQLIPASIRDRAAGGTVGFHPTPLPEGRGRAPVAWTILLDRPAAANLFFMTDEADAGDIIDQRPVAVLPNDYAQDLIDRTNEVLEQMVLDLAGHIKAGKLPRTPQDHAKATWYGKRTPADGLIDWHRPAADVHRLVRATSHPYPGAFTYHDAERMIVWRADLHERDDHHGTVGQVLRVEPGRGLLVQCGAGLLWLTEPADRAGRPIALETIRVGSKLGVPPPTPDTLGSD
jgi:methionyl-tRNA formyltransferase